METNRVENTQRIGTYLITRMQTHVLRQETSHTALCWHAQQLVSQYGWKRSQFGVSPTGLQGGLRKARRALYSLVCMAVITSASLERMMRFFDHTRCTVKPAWLRFVRLFFVVYRAVTRFDMRRIPAIG